MYDTKAHDCTALERENEALREAERQRQEQEMRDRQEHRRKMYAERSAALRHPADWPDAFRKQRKLIASEIAFVRKCIAELTTGLPHLDAAERARDLASCEEDLRGLLADLEGIDLAEKVWHEERARIAAEIEALEEAMRARVAAAVTAKIGEDKRSYGFCGELVKCLETNDPEGWLNW